MPRPGGFRALHGQGSVDGSAGLHLITLPALEGRGLGLQPHCQ